MVGEHFNQSFGNALEGFEGHFLETARTVFLEMFWSRFWADVNNEWAHRSRFYTLDDSCAGDFRDLPLFLCLFLNDLKQDLKMLPSASASWKIIYLKDFDDTTFSSKVLLPEWSHWRRECVKIKLVRAILVPFSVPLWKRIRLQLIEWRCSALMWSELLCGGPFCLHTFVLLGEGWRSYGPLLLEDGVAPLSLLLSVH